MDRVSRKPRNRARGQPGTGSSQKTRKRESMAWSTSVSWCERNTDSTPPSPANWVPNDSTFNGGGGVDSVGLMHGCVGSFGDELNPDSALLNSGRERSQRFVRPGDPHAASGIVSPSVQRTVQGASVQVAGTHGTTTVRAGVFHRMEAVLQTNEGDPKAPRFNGSAISRGQAPGIRHIAPSVHGPR